MTTAATTAPPRNAGDADAASLGMWVFLASEVLFFGGLLVAYASARMHWPGGFAAASHETHVVIGTVNTAILLTSSAFVALAVLCGKSIQIDEQAGNQARWVTRFLVAACVLGVAFMVLKGVEYTKEWHEHLVPGPNFRLRGTPGAELFFVLYFLITGLHAVHLTIGIVVLATFVWGTSRARAWAPARRIETAGLYWHFVDIVWIFLYPLIYLGGRTT